MSRPDEAFRGHEDRDGSGRVEGIGKAGEKTASIHDNTI